MSNDNVSRRSAPERGLRVNETIPSDGADRAIKKSVRECFISCTVVFVLSMEFEGEKIN